ncbi:MAG: glycosyltransferase family 4 protein [Candidatus Hodarchaeota archaeon]
MRSRRIRIFITVCFDGYNGIRPIDRDRRKVAQFLTRNDRFSFFSISNPVKPIASSKNLAMDQLKFNKSIKDKANFVKNLIISSLFAKFDIINTIKESYIIELYRALKNRNRKAKHIFSLLNDPIRDAIGESAEQISIKANWAGDPIFSKKMALTNYKTEKFLINNADIITGNSNRIVCKVKEFYDRDCYYLPEGVDINYFNPQNRFKQLNDRKSLIVTYIGSFQIRKQPILIKHLAEEFPQHRFYCFGKGAYREELQKLSQSFSNLKVFPPLSPNLIKKVYLISDIFFFPSVFEGMPKVLLEAGSSGLPVLASNETSHHEVVKENKTGYLFSDPDEMIEKFIKLEDPRRRKVMGQKFRQMIEERYAIDITAKSFNKLLLKLI